MYILSQCIKSFLRVDVEMTPYFTNRSNLLEFNDGDDAGSDAGSGRA